MVIFITGISSGFGLETARLLSQEGHTVYGTVRREVEPLMPRNSLRSGELRMTLLRIFSQNSSLRSKSA